MPQFSLRDFVNNPSLSQLEDGSPTKADWRHIAHNYNITAHASLRMAELKEVVVRGLIDLDILPMEPSRLFPDVGEEEAIGVQGLEPVQVTTPCIITLEKARLTLEEKS